MSVAPTSTQCSNTTFWSGQVSSKEVPEKDSWTFARNGLSATPTTTKGGSVVGGGRGIEIDGLAGVTSIALRIVVM